MTFVVFNFIPILNAMFGLFIAVAILYFVWGFTFYVWEMGSEIEKKEYKNMLLNGATALVVLLIVFAVVQTVENIL